MLLNYNHFSGGAGADIDDVNACSGYGDCCVIFLRKKQIKWGRGREVSPLMFFLRGVKKGKRVPMWGAGTLGGGDCWMMYYNIMMSRGVTSGCDVTARQPRGEVTTTFLAGRSPILTR